MESIAAQKKRGLEVKGLESMILKVDVGGGSWICAREEDDNERMSALREGIRLPVTKNIIQSRRLVGGIGTVHTIDDFCMVIV